MTRPGLNRQVYPHIEEKVGEDPARFLDREILVQSGLQTVTREGYRPDVRVSDPLEFIASRIQGIDRLEVIGAWLYVEADLLRTPDRSETDQRRDGRPKIRELLHERATELEAEGGRDEKLQHRREIVVDDDQEDDVETIWQHTKDGCGSTDVVQESAMAWFCNDCEQRTNRVEPVGEREVVPA